jgi:hypothetical protein
MLIHAVKAVPPGESYPMCRCEKGKRMTTEMDALIADVAAARQPFEFLRWHMDHHRQQIAAIMARQERQAG